MLFVSSLFLLLDVVPTDFLPDRLRQQNAINTLRMNQNILGNIPANMNVNLENEKEKFIKDSMAFSVLIALVRKNSSSITGLELEKIIGIGYARLSLPVGSRNIEAFHPLYLATFPNDVNSSVLELTPIGRLEDLDEWLLRQHQKSLQFWAGLLLVIGFLLQIVEERRYKQWEAAGAFDRPTNQ